MRTVSVGHPSDEFDGLSYPTLLLGAIDASVAINCLFSTDVTNWYAATLALKVCIALFSRTRLVSMPGVVAAFLIVLAALSGLSALNQNGTYIAYIQMAGFIAQFSLTAVMVKGPRLSSYLVGASVLLTALAIAHEALCIVGVMPAEWERSTILVATTPILGGEIDAAAAVAALIGMRYPVAVAAILALFLDTVIMQAKMRIAGLHSRPGSVVSRWKRAKI